ncbi:hypothetical protein HPB51_026970 [Rhipicephalus microplus]|uniref:THAP9-like helix-turn-helix domain-containing protein n=1 Tax=Rhipicephalus microplus TaxID=6941 RepID=A0A9J6D1M2_RHIMP|nr:hypothetical protein HPB51_026970 [Rhipicephalus microplus]
MLSEERCTYRHLAQAIHSLLDKLEASIDEGKKETVNIMKEQLLLLSAKRIQYSAQVMVFACILRTMSPHAYKFLRSTGALTLPHPALLEMCARLFKCAHKLILLTTLSFTMCLRDSNICRHMNNLFCFEFYVARYCVLYFWHIFSIKGNILCCLSSAWTENNAHCDICTDGVWL